MPRCFFALTVDTECDKAEHWRTRYPIRCANIIEELPQLFHRRAVALGLRPTYLLSPEVLRDRDAVAALRSLESTYELGTHLHGEYIEPEADWNAPGTYAMQCNYSAEVEWQKLRNLTALFQEVIGESPRSFRAGRYGIAARSIAMLERLGYWVDSSVTPYKWWAPNVRFLDAPVLPYTPSTEDLCRAGQGQLLELPVSVYPGAFGWLPSAWRRRFNPYHPVVAWLWRRWNRYVWDLRPRLFYAAFTPLPELLRTVDWYLKLAQRTGSDVALVMTCHSCEFRPGANPYFSSRSQCQRFLDTMFRTAEYALRRGCIGATLAEIAQQLRPMPAPAQ